MSIEKVELLEDRVRISYHLRKPDFVKDVDDTIEVLYANVGNLPPLPEKPYECPQEVPLLHMNKTLVLYFPENQERAAGANIMDESMYGPYLKE